MENKKVDFINQRIVIGLDVHKKSWTVTIMLNGIVLKKYTMNPNPKELARYLQKNYPNAEYESVYEAGFCGYWIDRELRKLGIKNIIVNPADVPMKNKEKRRKSDNIDSGKLARELSNGALESIYVPTEKQEGLRSLSRLRMQFVKDQTRMKNRIKSLLNYMGVDISEEEVMQHWSGKYIEKLRELKFKEQSVKQTLEGLLEALTQIRDQQSKTTKKLREEVQKDERTRRIMGHLQSIPGIGFITAITVYTEIMEIRRFSKFEKLCSYVGLAPEVKSSGENEKVIGISKQQNKYLRSMLVESAWIAIRKDPALTMSFGLLSQRMKKQEAIIRIAKKLLSRIMHVWNKEEDYVYAVVA